MPDSPVQSARKCIGSQKFIFWRTGLEPFHDSQPLLAMKHLPGDNRAEIVLKQVIITYLLDRTGKGGSLFSLTE